MTTQEKIETIYSTPYENRSEAEQAELGALCHSLAHQLTRSSAALLTQLHHESPRAATRGSFCKAETEFQILTPSKGRTSVMVYRNDDLRTLLKIGAATVEGIDGVGIITITTVGQILTSGGHVRG